MSLHQMFIYVYSASLEPNLPLQNRPAFLSLQIFPLADSSRQISDARVPASGGQLSQAVAITGSQLPRTQPPVMAAEELLKCHMPADSNRDLGLGFPFFYPCRKVTEIIISWNRVSILHKYSNI